MTPIWQETVVQGVVALVGGVVGGLGWSALWELYLRPKRARRDISIALLSEVAANIISVDEALRHSPTGRPPDAFAMQTIVFGAVADRLGDIDPEMLGWVARAYQLSEECNRRSLTYQRLDQALSVPDMGPIGSSLFVRREEMGRQFYTRLALARDVLILASQRLASVGRKNIKSG